MREGKAKGRGVRRDIKMRRHEVELRGHDPVSQCFNYVDHFSYGLIKCLKHTELVEHCT